MIWDPTTAPAIVRPGSRAPRTAFTAAWIPVLRRRLVQTVVLMVLVVAVVVPFDPAGAPGLTPGVSELRIEPVAVADTVQVAQRREPPARAAAPRSCVPCRAAAAVRWDTDARQRAALA